jgi:DNA polymerase III epsilon subunit family exonuclease
MTVLPGQVIVLDLETTGEDYRLDRIIEVGAVRLDGDREVETFHAWVDPGGPLRPSNIAIHGITDEMLAGAESLAIVLQRLRDFLGTWPWVAHNAPFDQRFLQHHGQACGIAFENPVFDSLALAREVFPSDKGLSLARLAERLGVEPRPTHRALEDARALAAVYPLLREQVEAGRRERRARFSEISDLALRYRELTGALASMQTELKDLRRILDLYLDETGLQAIEVPGRGRWRAASTMRHTFHPEEVRAVLADLGLLEPCLRLDRERVARLAEGDRLSPGDREALLATRRELGVQRTLHWEEEGL